jgi:hypothetical protein
MFIYLETDYFVDRSSLTSSVHDGYVMLYDLVIIPTSVTVMVVFEKVLKNRSFPYIVYKY